MNKKNHCVYGMHKSDQQKFRKGMGRAIMVGACTYRDRMVAGEDTKIVI